MYKEFVELYNSGIKVKDLKNELGLTDAGYRKYYYQAKKNKDIVSRRKSPNINGKNYYKTREGTYRITKMIDNKVINYGEYKTEEMAIFAVELLKTLDWDIDYKWSVKRQTIEEFNYMGGNEYE